MQQAAPLRERNAVWDLITALPATLAEVTFPRLVLSI